MRHFLSPAVGLVGVALLSAPAAGAPMLGIQLAEAGYASYTQTGANPLIVSTPYGTFSTTVNTGTAAPVPVLDLSSVDISSTSPGHTLTISLSESGLTSPIGASDWLTQLTGHFASGAGTFSLSSYIDTADTLFGTGTPLSGPITAGEIARAEADTIDPFALTLVLTLNTTTASASHPAFLSADGSVGFVPEPAGLSVLCVGLLGVVSISRKRYTA